MNRHPNSHHRPRSRLTRSRTRFASVRGFIEAILEEEPDTVIGRKEVPPAKR